MINRRVEKVSWKTRRNPFKRATYTSIKDNYICDTILLRGIRRQQEGCQNSKQVAVEFCTVSWETSTRRVASFSQSGPLSPCVCSFWVWWSRNTSNTGTEAKTSSLWRCGDQIVRRCGIRLSGDWYIYRTPALAFLYSYKDAFPFLSVLIFSRCLALLLHLCHHCPLVYYASGILLAISSLCEERKEYVRHISNEWKQIIVEFNEVGWSFWWLLGESHAYSDVMLRFYQYLLEDLFSLSFFLFFFK